jgi:hypothetical protein
MIPPIAIAWKIQTERLGYIAEFCQFCHQIRVASLHRQTQLTDVYFIRVGSAELDNLLQCLSCGLLFTTDSMRYKSISTQSNDLDSLILETQPDISVRYRDALSINEDIRRGTFDTEERLGLIRDRFTTIEPMLLRGENKIVAEECLIPILCTIPVGFIARYFFSNNEVAGSAFMLSALGFSVIFAPAYYFSCKGADKRRLAERIKNVFQPALASGLAFLKPTNEEMTRVIQKLNDDNYKIASLSNIGEIMSAINS